MWVKYMVNAANKTFITAVYRFPFYFCVSTNMC